MNTDDQNEPDNDVIVFDCRSEKTRRENADNDDNDDDDDDDDDDDGGKRYLIYNDETINDSLTTADCSSNDGQRTATQKKMLKNPKNCKKGKGASAKTVKGKKTDSNLGKRIYTKRTIKKAGGGEKKKKATTLKQSIPRISKQARKQPSKTDFQFKTVQNETVIPSLNSPDDRYEISNLNAPRQAAQVYIENLYWGYGYETK